MGIKLMVEVMDHAPESLTWRELWVLQVLAEDANDVTRLCWPGFEGESAKSVRFRERVRCSRSQFYATVKALTDKGALEIARRGQKHVQAEYRIAAMRPQGPGNRDADADPQGPEIRDAEDRQRPGNRDAEPRPQGPENQDTDESQRPGNRDAEGAQRPGFRDAEPQGPENRDAEDPQGPGFEISGSRFPKLRVPETGTPSPQSPQNPSSLSAPVEFVRAAGVVAEDEERDFADWITKTFNPGSPAWWCKVLNNGHMAAHAARWRAERTPRKAPSLHPPIAQVLAAQARY